MPFLPKDFEVPTGPETQKFRIRPLTIHHVDKDYDAVMSSRTELWRLFGEAWGWPPEDLTHEQDLIDLGWHQKEGQLKRSFAYVVEPLDESAVWGCFYIDPSTREGFDAEAYYWVRTDQLMSGLEATLFRICKEWLDREWPFQKVAFPGREISWEEWGKLPPRQV